MRPRNLRPCRMQRALSACRRGQPEWGLLGVPLCCEFYGIRKGSKLGPVANNGDYFASLGCCLGIFDLVGGNGPCQHAGLGGLYGAY